MKRLLLALVACSCLSAQEPGLPLPPPVADQPKQESRLRGHVDWQGHPAMHIPLGFLGENLDEGEPRWRLSWRHTFRQTMHVDYLTRSETRVLVAAAMAAERGKDPEHARALILEQLAYVRELVGEHSEHFALATTPEEARRLLRSTRKTVVLHAIEGARHVLNSQEDADFWAKQGVMMVTLIHLQDDEFGGAGIRKALTAPLVNYRGSWRKLRGKRRGLTEQGQQAIVWLAKAGILVDLTHMSADAVVDSLEVTRRWGIPPLVTHGWARSIKADGRSFTDDQIVEVYRQGGCFQIPLSGGAIDPYKPTLEVPAGLRKGTLDSFVFHYRTLDALLKRNVGEVFPGVRCYDELSEAQKTQLSVGWASDWNGWTNHSKPTHRGRKARRAQARGELLEVDVRGLAHPGLLPEYWQRVEQAGVDMDPLLRQPEQLLRVWSAIRSWTPPVR